MMKSIAFVGPLLDKLAGAFGWAYSTTEALSEYVSSPKREGKATLVGWAAVVAGWFGFRPEDLVSVGTFISNVGLGIARIAQSMGG